MENLKIYSVTDEYVDYLRMKYPNVYSNEQDTRVHTRKYVGVVIKLEKYNYYVPLSSPKDTDYQVAGDSKVIKKSIVPIVRIVVKNSKGEKELKGTLRISHMIPVPKSELQLYDLENETDEVYKDLVSNEILFIRKNKEKILNNAKLLYKQKSEEDQSAGYVKMALDYKSLEKMCDKYKETMRVEKISMIRKTTPEDIPYVMNIIHDAQAGMKLLGISQWQNGYPNEESFAKDIAEGISHVYVEDGEIVATAAIFCAPEPDYAKIYEGAWKTNGNYGVVHRIAVKKEAKRAGYAAKMIEYAVEMAEQKGCGSIRIDTHEGNVPMRSFLKKQGFEECGIIYLSNEGCADNKRVAYEKVID